MRAKILNHFSFKGYRLNTSSTMRKFTMQMYTVFQSPYLMLVITYNDFQSKLAGTCTLKRINDNETKTDYNPAFYSVYCLSRFINNPNPANVSNCLATKQGVLQRFVT
jgi:hypothetical protein